MTDSRKSSEAVATRTLPPHGVRVTEVVRPISLLRGGHRQTVLGAFTPAPALEHPGERYEVPLGDGDRLVVRFHAARVPGRATLTASDRRGSVLGASAPHDSPPRLAILLHGLGGSMDSNYIREFAHELLARGYSVLRVNHRGVGDGLTLASGIYHSGRYADLAAVIRHARATFPHSTISALGFSFSANLLLNQLGHLREDLPDYTLAVNPPIDLAESARQLDIGFGRVYNQLFTRDLMALVRLKRAAGLFPKEINLEKVRSLRDFDNHITAPLAGARDRAEYYHLYSSERVLAAITAPCAVLSTLDDPIIGGEHFLHAPWSASTRVRLERHGGHLGYLSREGKRLVALGMEELAALHAAFPLPPPSWNRSELR